jgi:hypothetical protein
MHMCDFCQAEDEQRSLVAMAEAGRAALEKETRLLRERITGRRTAPHRTTPHRTHVHRSAPHAHGSGADDERNLEAMEAKTLRIKCEALNSEKELMAVRPPAPLGTRVWAALPDSTFLFWLRAHGALPVSPVTREYPPSTLRVPCTRLCAVAGPAGERTGLGYSVEAADRAGWAHPTIPLTPPFGLGFRVQ